MVRNSQKRALLGVVMILLAYMGFFYYNAWIFLSFFVEKISTDNYILMFLLE